MPTTRPLPPAGTVSHWGLWPGFVPGNWTGAVPGGYLILTQASARPLSLTPYVDTPWAWAVYPASFLYPGLTTFPGRGAIQLATAHPADPATAVPSVLQPDAPPAVLSVAAAGVGVAALSPNTPGSATLTAVPVTPLTLTPNVAQSKSLGVVGVTTLPLVKAEYLVGTYPGAPTYPGVTTYPGHTPQIRLVPDPVV